VGCFCTVSFRRTSAGVHRLAEFYKASEGMFQKQKALASEIAALKPVLGSLPENKEDPTLLASTTPEIGEAPARGTMTLPRDSDAAFNKWSSSIG